MMLSVMVMGAGAAFTDQDKIVNEEAVDMISALGIVDGYEDDSFQPEKNIERGEAAKMIAVMLNGGKDAVQDTSVSSFNDVLGSADAWANKYIEYGVSKGILAGVGGDRFAPASNVTGTQLAKMLLVSLGYDADKEGYLDDTSWAVNVNTDAASVGLYKGLESIDMNAALTRDNAAQMIWNALNANTVKYFLGSLIENDSTLLQTAFGDDYGVDTGILTNIEWNQDRNEYTYTIDGNEYVSAGDYTDLFAMNVADLHDGSDALLVRVDEGGTVVEGVVGDIGGVSNTHFNTITVNGQKYTLDNVANDWDAVWDITCGYNQYNELGTGWWHNGPDVRDQYSFRAIDQDGGGDIDVIVVYPYVVLRTETVLKDTFVAREIKGDDASLTVGPDEQDRSLIADILFDGGNKVQTGPMSAEIEYDDIVLNGTVAENGYVKVVPAAYTAEDIDTYTVLDINSGVANKLNTNDYMVTFDSTEYDGNLVNVVVPISTISLGETYGFVEVNGYLFIVDGNNIGPVKDEYVVVTKTALAPEGVDKLWETNILKTDGTTETVDVYVSLNDQHYGPEVGSLYTVRTDLDGNYELIAVPEGTYTTKNENTNFDVQQAYKDGATLNNASRWSAYHWGIVSVNPGVSGMYGENTAGSFFYRYNGYNGPAKHTTYQVEDDAVIFVYNRMMDSYSVVKGSDLANVADEITWSFTGATAKVYNGTPTVDLGYVAVCNDPDETLVYAYVDGNPDRIMSDGGYVLTVDVILNGGEKVTLTSQKYATENDPDLMRIYNALTNDPDGIFQLIVDGSTLVDIKAYSPAESDTLTVTAALYNGVIKLEGQKYFVDASTEFIPVSGNADSIADIKPGVEIHVILDVDDSGKTTNDILAVIY